MPNVVECWFGEAFSQLDPKIQQLHRDGGTLTGTCRVSVGTGLNGFLGRYLARRLGIPRSGSNQLRVSISVEDDALVWKRSFNANGDFVSRFAPVGRYPDGYWVESTNALQIILGVEIVNNGWQWRQRGIRRGRIRLPNWLAPRVEASKIIRAGHYDFHVVISAPVFGILLSYGGRLEELCPSSN
jgi:hypothetical protein